MLAILEKMMGVDKLTDEIIATDLLISAKSGVKDYAFAVTETTTLEAEAVLRKQLGEAIESHEKISTYMIDKGWYQPIRVQEGTVAGGSLAPHETMETHEILNFKTLCLLKTKMMQGVVFDQELKRLMEKDVQRTIQEVNELQGLITRTTIH